MTTRMTRDFGEAIRWAEPRRWAGKRKSAPRSTRMFRRTLTTAAIAVAALALASTGTALGSSVAGHAGGVKTGTWRGTIQNQELSFAEGSYTTKIVVKANHGRISWVAA